MFTWTPDTLLAYAAVYYRVRADQGSMPLVVLRLDGWQVGERWCLTAEEACNVLNKRGATPLEGERFKRNTGESLHDTRGMEGESAGRAGPDDDEPDLWIDGVDDDTSKPRNSKP